jgi:hypothetical protein
MSGKTVREQWARTGVAGVNANFFGAQKSLGGGMGAWRVVSPTTISVSRREQNYTKFITVHVSGKSCSVTWQGQLDSGQANYRGLIDVAIHTHTKPAMLDSSCSIK